MKKLMLFAVVCLFTAILCGCESNNTPKGVVEKSMKCLKNKDYKGYVKLLYFKGEEEMEPAKLKKSQEQTAVLLEGKMDEQFEKNNGIDSYEIGEETVEGNEAKVKVTIKYGNGEEDTNDVKLKKDSKDNWKIDVGK